MYKFVHVQGQHALTLLVILNYLFISHNLAQICCKHNLFMMMDDDLLSANPFKSENVLMMADFRPP